jgi:hypothetical protein
MSGKGKGGKCKSKSSSPQPCHKGCVMGVIAGIQDTVRLNGVELRQEDLPPHLDSDKELSFYTSQVLQRLEKAGITAQYAGKSVRNGTSTLIDHISEALKRTGDLDPFLDVIVSKTIESVRSRWDIEDDGKAVSRVQEMIVLNDATVRAMHEMFTLRKQPKLHLCRKQRSNAKLLIEEEMRNLKAVVEGRWLTLVTLGLAVTRIFGVPLTLIPYHPEITRGPRKGPKFNDIVEAAFKRGTDKELMGLLLEEFYFLAEQHFKYKLSDPQHPVWQGVLLSKESLRIDEFFFHGALRRLMLGTSITSLDYKTTLHYELVCNSVNLCESRSASVKNLCESRSAPSDSEWRKHIQEYKDELALIWDNWPRPIWSMIPQVPPCVLPRCVWFDGSWSISPSATRRDRHHLNTASNQTSKPSPGGTGKSTDESTKHN